MRQHALLFAHATAYAVALLLGACGPLDVSAGAQDANAQSPVAGDGNVFSATPSPNTVIPGNANTTGTNNTNNTGTSVNDTNATNSNSANANTTVAPLDCNNTWTSYAQTFFTSNCANCHSHNHSNLTDYNHVVSIAPTVQNFIGSRVMPVGTTLSAQDYNAILTWFACETPQ